EPAHAARKARRQGSRGRHIGGVNGAEYGIPVTHGRCFAAGWTLCQWLGFDPGFLSAPQAPGGAPAHPWASGVALFFVRSLKRRAAGVRPPWLPRTRSAARSRLLGPAALAALAMGVGPGACRHPGCVMPPHLVIRRLDRRIQSRWPLDSAVKSASDDTGKV